MPIKIKSRKGKTAIKARCSQLRLKRGIDVEEGARGRWVLVVEVASLFAEPLNFGFSLLARGVNQPANPGDAPILADWF